MTSGFYPVAPIVESSFITTYETLMNGPQLVPKSEFTPGYQGHRPGVKYIIGQSLPAGNPTSPNIDAAYTIKPLESIQPVHQRARSEQPLGERKTSRKRSPTPRTRKFIFPESLGGSYVPPAFIRVPPTISTRTSSSATKLRPEAPSPRSALQHGDRSTITAADGRGSGYDNVRARLGHL
jgi:hypothetical protein